MGNKLIICGDCNVKRIHYAKGLCQKCYKKQHGEKYRIENKEQIKESHKGYRVENKDEIKEYNKEYYTENKKSILEYQKEYKIKNPEKRKETIKKSAIKNKNKIKEYRKEYEEIPINLLKSRTRHLIRMSFSNKGIKKDTKTEEIIGCSWKEWHDWIESQFTEGMTWNNYGGKEGWSIDHYIPLIYGKTKKQIKKLNNYKNLRPMWLNENISKNDNLPEDLNEKLKELGWFN
jgi:hypothetical protein